MDQNDKFSGYYILLWNFEQLSIFLLSFVVFYMQKNILPTRFTTYNRSDSILTACTTSLWKSLKKEIKRSFAKLIIMSVSISALKKCTIPTIATFPILLSQTTLPQSIRSDSVAICLNNLLFYGLTWLRRRSCCAVSVVTCAISSRAFFISRLSFEPIPSESPFRRAVVQ